MVRKAGPANTEETIKLAIEAAQEREIGYLVVASTWGNTALKALELLKDTPLKLIVITHNTGFSEPGEMMCRELTIVGQQLDAGPEQIIEIVNAPY